MNQLTGWSAVSTGIEYWGKTLRLNAAEQRTPMCKPANADIKVGGLLRIVLSGVCPAKRTAAGSHVDILPACARRSSYSRVLSLDMHCTPIFWILDVQRPVSSLTQVWCMDHVQHVDETN